MPQLIPEPIPMNRCLAVLLTLCFCLSACNGKPVDTSSAAKPPVPPPQAMFTGSTPEDQAKNMIVRYCQLLVYGYENLDMNPLQEVATARLAERAYHHMAAIGEGGVRMTSRVKKIDVTLVRFTLPGKATVKSREVWDFAYNDIRTGVKKEEMKDFVYLMEYTLEKHDGRWLIVDIAAGSEEKPKTPAQR